MTVNLTSRKGFFFVLATLIVLSYILASITLWTKSMEAAERAYAERFRISNLELAASQVSPQSLKRFAEISVYHALYTINDYASVSGQTLRYDPDPAHRYDRMSNSFASMVENGTLYEKDFDNFDPTSANTFAPDQNNIRSLKAWAETLNDSIGQSGLAVKDATLVSFTIKESDAVAGALDYTIQLRLVLVDKTVSGTGEKASLSRDYATSGRVFIDGMSDPAVFRETGGVIKQFFFNRDSNGDLIYENPVDLKPVLLMNGEEGQGWFYGPVVDVSEALNIRQELRRYYIISGHYMDISRSAYADFGAFIQTDSPQKAVGSSCDMYQVFDQVFNAVTCNAQTGNLEFQRTPIFEKPYIVAPGFNPSALERDYYDPLDPGMQVPLKNSRVLIVSDYSSSDIGGNPIRKFSGSRIYEMEKIRDFAICGYYVRNDGAPSYVDRLFADPYSYANPDSGIETFVFGTWTAGNFSGLEDAPYLSKLDREFFDGISGQKVRGMPGCKNVVDCNSDKSPIGPFRLVNGASAINYLDTSGTNQADDYLLCLIGGDCESVK